MQPLNIAIDGLTLDTVVGVARGDEPVTLLDAIVNAAVDRLTKDAQYVDAKRRLSERTAVIRDQVIRDQVEPLVAAAVAAPIQQTNMFGEPTGKSTTLRELISAQVNAFFTKNVTDGYRDTKTTAAQALVAAAVDKALKTELLAVVKVEKDKVVAAVQAKAAELIATAVREGVGYPLNQHVSGGEISPGQRRSIVEGE